MVNPANSISLMAIKLFNLKVFKNIKIYQLKQSMYLKT